MRKAHVFKIRDKVAEKPGKANAYISKRRALLDFAGERDWISSNPAAGVPRLELGEYEPRPATVLEAALAKASPMVRLAIITGLCSGQRLSDVILMQHGWHDGTSWSCGTKRRTLTQPCRCTLGGWRRSRSCRANP